MKMKINRSIIISIIAIVIGLLLKTTFLWLPISVLVAGIIDSITRRWVLSDELGSHQKQSILIKFFLSLVIGYASLGQYICLALTTWWIIIIFI